MKKLLILIIAILLVGCQSELKNSNDITDIQFLSGCVEEVSENILILKNEHGSYSFKYDLLDFQVGDFVKIGYSINLPEVLLNQGIIEHFKSESINGRVVEVKENSFLLDVNHSPYIVYTDIDVEIDDIVKIYYRDIIQTCPQQIKPFSVELINENIKIH